jgi:hypothetical protein
VVCFAIIAPSAALVAAVCVAWTGSCACFPDAEAAGSVAFAAAFRGAAFFAGAAAAVTVVAGFPAAFVVFLAGAVLPDFEVTAPSAVFFPAAACCAAAFAAVVVFVPALVAGLSFTAFAEVFAPFVAGSFVAGWFTDFFAAPVPRAPGEPGRAAAFADRTPGASRKRSAAAAVAFAVALRAFSAMGYPHMQNGRAAGAAHSE